MSLPSVPLSCVVVDDNEMNRITLEHLIELMPELELAASLAGGLEALQYFRDGGRADLLFLDVEMPMLSGLELAQLLPAPQPTVIMVTSHRDFAVAAFELQVADYLLKPVTMARFSQAVQRVLDSRRKLATAQEAETAVAKTVGSELFVKVGTRMVRLNFDEVLYIEALSTYSILVTPTQKHIVYLTLKALMARLPFAHFVRVHRSYIVNTQRIEAIEDNMLRLGAYEVPVGKSYQEEFLRGLRSL